MRSIVAGWILAGLTLLSGCVAPRPQLAPLEIQAIQSREFEATKPTAFASVLSVFQDLGYIVESADKDTGFITAKSPTAGSVSILTGRTYQSATKATAFVEELRPGHTKVRLNFVLANQASSRQGQISQRDEPVLDSKVYVNAFDKIEDAIFVRSASQ
ncbi:MAG: hypothetical protein ACREA0_02100 [bacterium]